MHIKIELDTDNDAFKHGQLYHELRRLFESCLGKIKRQRRRAPALCDAPEVDDKLLDINGNTVGTLTVTRS